MLMKKTILLMSGLFGAAVLTTLALKRKLLNSFKTENNSDLLIELKGEKKWGKNGICRGKND